MPGLTVRATRSSGPAAALGTIRRIGRCGYGGIDCVAANDETTACAPASSGHQRQPAVSTRSARLMRLLVGDIRTGLLFDSMRALGCLQLFFEPVRNDVAHEREVIALAVLRAAFLGRENAERL